MNDKPTFLMMGIGGVYNYGCEAIVRGTETIIRDKWPDARIIYASRRPEDDKLRLCGSSVDIVPRNPIGRYSTKNIIRKLLSYTGIKWRPVIDSASLLEDVDAMLSIGGDIYTLWSNNEYNISLPKFGDWAENRGIPCVLWAASVGPFNDNSQAESFFKKHLSGISMISAREKDTLDYLKSIGIVDNVVSCADPAFCVAPEITQSSSVENGKLTIGLNLSPLSANRLGIDLYDAIAVQAQVIEKLIEKFNAQVLLIPHVICDFNEGDDDLRYLKRIMKEISLRYQRQVSILDTDPGFIGTKEKLIKCDLVIAARMHCTINAMAAHVPTLLLAYSQKAQGMSEYIYGHKKWMVPLCEFASDKCLATINEMLSTQNKIRDFLANRIPSVQKEAFGPLVKLSEILN